MLLIRFNVLLGVLKALLIGKKKLVPSIRVTYLPELTFLTSPYKTWQKLARLEV